VIVATVDTRLDSAISQLSTSTTSEKDRKESHSVLQTSHCFFNVPVV